MADSVTLTIRLEKEVKEKLARLAEHARRTKSFLAAEAIEQYVGRELDIIEGIEEGIEDMRAGRLVSHREAISKLHTAVNRAQKKKA
ncbi:MAG: CopG family ribbon-helix-helix protein [Hyphomicrobiales bacterium]